jgi:hypothetical protein
MKKTYKLICIRRDKKWEEDMCTYVITPISKGLQAIQSHLSNNSFDGKYIEFLAKEASQEEAVFILKGKKKNIQEAIHSLLCDTDLANYFKLEERGY